MEIDGAAIGRAELLGRLRRGQAEVADLIAQFGEEQAAAPGGDGEWSVADVLAHFIVHQQHALAELRHALRGERPPHDHRTNDQRNADAVESMRSRSWADVRHAWESSCMDLVAQIAALADSDFDPTGPVVQTLDDTIDGAVANNSYEHWAEHLPQLRDRLRTRTAADAPRGQAPLRQPPGA
jgi:hypothetical protein